MLIECQSGLSNVNADDELDDVRNSVSHAMMLRLADIRRSAQPAK